MRSFTGADAVSRSLAAALVLCVWHALTLVYPPLVVPGIAETAAKFLDIVTSSSGLQAVGVTALRLLAGLAAGAGAGTFLGAVLGRCRRLRGVIQPLLGLMQSVPPISWLVLALIWFGFSGAASVFIAAVAALPVMAVNTLEGIAGVDAKLLEMGRVYRFSRMKTLRLIVIPSVLPHFRAGFRIAAGTASKAVVMGEVLTTASGIGGAITDARLNVDPSAVIAWTAVMVLLYFLFDGAASLALRGPRCGRKHA